MRLVRQYRNDKAILMGRCVLIGFFLVVIYVLVSSTFSAISGNYVEAQNSQQDQQLVNQAQLSDENDPVDQRIAKREALLAKVQGKSTTGQLKRQLASLYERKGQDSAGQGDSNTAEFCFKRATELDPGNPNYYTETAQLYADDAVRQKTAGSQMELYRSSVDLYDRALDKEQDPERRREISNSAAYASYGLAKVEFSIPTGKGLAIQDLQKAKELATPGTQTASDIEQLFLLAAS